MQADYKQRALEQTRPSAPLSECIHLHDLQHAQLTQSPGQDRDSASKPASTSDKPNRLLQPPRALGRQLSRGVSHICQHQSLKRLKSDVMCLHIVDGLLTHQVVDEVRSELHAGAAPLVAFENVARSKLGAMATADVSRLVLVIGATCSACCGVVHITKGLLHLLARPLRLRKPVGLVTNVLMPTGLYGSLLGVYLGFLAVQGAVRELSAAAEPKKAVRQEFEETAVAGEDVTVVEKFASRGYQVAHSSSSQEKQGQQQQQRRQRPWWAFWNRNRQQEQQAAATSCFGMPMAESASDSSDRSEADGGSVAVVVPDTDATAGLAVEDGPETPDNKNQQQQQQQESPTTPSAAAAAATMPGPAGAGSGSSTAGRPGDHKGPGSPSADEGLDAEGLAEHLHQQRLRLRHLEPSPAAAAAVNGPLAAGALGSSSSQPALLLLPQLRVTHSLSPERSRRSISAAAEDASASPPFGEAVALRSVKSSGIYNTSADAVTPAEYGQTPLEAAGLRRFSCGDRDVNSTPSPQSSLVGRLSSMFSAAPFGPPVFSRLPSGKGICRITAAAAAAEELQQQQRLRTQGSLDLHNIQLRPTEGERQQSLLQDGAAPAAAAAGGAPGGPDAAGNTAAAAAAAAGTSGGQQQQKQHQWGDDDIVDRYLKKHKSLDCNLSND